MFLSCLNYIFEISLVRCIIFKLGCLFFAILFIIIVILPFWVLYILQILTSVGINWPRYFFFFLHLIDYFFLRYGFLCSWNFLVSCSLCWLLILWLQQFIINHKVFTRDYKFNLTTNVCLYLIERVRFRFLIIWSWALYSVRDNDQISFLYI